MFHRALDERRRGGAVRNGTVNRRRRGRDRPCSNSAKLADASSDARALSTTLHPALSRVSAAARPMPRDAPVTMATRPLRSMTVMVCAPSNRAVGFTRRGLFVRRGEDRAEVRPDRAIDDAQSAGLNAFFDDARRVSRDQAIRRHVLQLGELGVKREIVVGHDFRSYSASIKLAMTAGLMAGGVLVRDIGLAITPMAYFAQFALDTPAVAMVTASHNEQTWPGPG